MILKNLNKSLLINISLTILIFLLDRISKIYVIYLDEKLYGEQIFSSKFLNIQLIWNEGIAFGLFSFDQENLYNLLTIIILAVISFILYLLVNNQGLKKFSLTMIFAGALGNVYDRIFYNAVPDFIDFQVGEFHWFIFNVSDIFITIGVILMIILEIIDKPKNASHEKN